MLSRAMDKARGILKTCESNLQQAVSTLPNSEETLEPMEVSDITEVYIISDSNVISLISTVN